MANKNLRKNGANIQSPLDVQRAGTPVTSGIHRAAERAGIETPEEIELTEVAREAGVTVTEDNRPTLERMSHEKRLSKVKLTFTLRELCGAVGHGVSTADFAASALDEIAKQVEAEGHVCVEMGGRWEQLFSIESRAKFAASVVRKLAEAAS